MSSGKIKNFINLSNGIEAFERYGDRLHSPHFIRIQSTTLESKNWPKLLSELDYDFLMYLSLGYDCRVYDGGTRKHFSRALHQGLPIIDYVLTRYWLGRTPIPYRYTRAGEFVTHPDPKFYEHIYNDLFLYNSTKEKERVKSKLRYFKNYIKTGELRLSPVGWPTDHDGDTPYFREILHKNL